MSDLEQHSSFLGCFSQVFRIMVGPALILLTGATMIINRTSLGGPVDFVFGGVVFATVLASLVKPKPSPQTPSEAQESASGTTRYVLILLAASVALFLVVHFVLLKVL